MSPHEKSIAKQAVRAGQPIPDKIANAPELNLGLQLYLQAYFDLESDRPNGEAIGSIPWTSIISYAVAMQFDEEQAEDLLYFVKALDQEHVKWIAGKRKAASKNGKK